MLMFEYLLRGHCFSSHTVGVDGGGTGSWVYDGSTMTLMGVGAIKMTNWDTFPS